MRASWPGSKDGLPNFNVGLPARDGGLPGGGRRVSTPTKVAEVDGITDGVPVVMAGTEDERPATRAEQTAALLRALEGQAVL